jgi:hypothetical protein
VIKREHERGNREHDHENPAGDSEAPDKGTTETGKTCCIRNTQDVAISKPQVDLCNSLINTIDPSKTTTTSNQMIRKQQPDEHLRSCDHQQKRE